MVFPFVLLGLVGAAPKPSVEQLQRLDQTRTKVSAWVQATCSEATCLKWADGRFQFSGPTTLSPGVDDDDRQPSGKPWTDAALMKAFPEFRPEVLAYEFIRSDGGVLWYHLAIWLEADPQRLADWGPKLWADFAAANASKNMMPKLDAKARSGHASPWGGPWQFEHLARIGATAETIKPAIAVVRCANIFAAVDGFARKPGRMNGPDDPLPKDLLQQWWVDGPLTRGDLTDPWGSPFRLAQTEPGVQTVSRLPVTRGPGKGSLESNLRGWRLYSIGADRKSGTADDVPCEDDRVVREGPPGLKRPKVAPGPWDEALEHLGELSPSQSVGETPGPPLGHSPK